MELINNLCKYMSENKIDMVYIGNNTIINILLGNQKNVKDIIIVRDIIFSREVEMIKFYEKNNKENANLTIKDVINTFDVAIIGLIFENTKIDDFELFRQYRDCYYFDVSPFFNQLLFFKSEEELFKLHCSAYLTEKIICRILNRSVNKLYSENYITNLFLEECGKIGVKDTHINVTRQNSLNCLTPIYSIDCGISYLGFFSDITRMFCYDVLDEEIKEGVRFLTELQNVTVNMIRENMHIKDLFITLNKRYRYNYMFKRVQNGFGHGIGKRIHEGYSLCSNQKWTFQNGYSFTLEPILTFDNVELRIENMYEMKGGQVRRINTFLSDDIIMLPNKSAQQKSYNEVYCVNPEVIILEGSEGIFLANLNCESLSKGKASYLKISKSILTIIKEFQQPSPLTEIKRKYQKSREYIDFLITEEVLLNKK